MLRIAIVLGLALLSAPVRAEGPTAPSTPLALLTRERVQKELKLSDEQIATVKKLHAGVKKDPTTAAAALTTLRKTLQPKQVQRLGQISYQVRGGAVLTDPDVASKLDLTPKQKDEVRSIWLDEEKTLGMLLKVARFRNETIRQSFIANHRKKAGEKMLAALSAAQQKQFAGLLGEKFDLTGLNHE